MAFRGLPEDVGRLAERRPSLRVETVPGGDHFYTGVRAELLGRLDAWLRALVRP